MKNLKTVDADTLLYQPLDKPSFVVDGPIPTGLSLFCGAQKIGKSWLILKLCLYVSEGQAPVGTAYHGRGTCCTCVWRTPFTASRTGCSSWQMKPATACASPWRAAS